MKKSILAMVISALVLILSACNSDTPVAANPSPTEEPTVEATPTPEPTPKPTPTKKPTLTPRPTATPTLAATEDKSSLDNLEDTLLSLEASANARNKLDEIQETIDLLTVSIGLTHWEVILGIGLEKDDAAGYREDIDEYINACNEYIDQQRYVTILALKFYNAYDIEAASMMKTFYDDYADEMSGLGSDLKDTVYNAFEDGLLESGEVKKVIEIQDKMAKILAEISGNE